MAGVKLGAAARLFIA